MIKNNKENMVTKSNCLVEARYKLSLEEQRLILFIISKINPNDEDFKEYEISVREFSGMINTTTKGLYSRFKEIATNLIKHTLTIRRNQNTLITAWLSSAEYIENEGKIILCFDPKLKPYLLDLKKNFTSYKLKNIINLKSIFSIRLYELLKQYQKIGRREFAKNELIEIMQIKESYTYHDIKRNVLLKPQKEFKEKTDICFEFEEIKTGRRVDRINFIIFSNKKVSFELLNSENTSEVDENLLENTNTNEDAYMDKLEVVKWILKEHSLSKKDLLAILESADGNLDLISSRYEYAKLSKKENMTDF